MSKEVLSVLKLTDADRDTLSVFASSKQPTRISIGYGSNPNDNLVYLDRAAVVALRKFINDHLPAQADEAV